MQTHTIKKQEILKLYKSLSKEDVYIDGLSQWLKSKTEDMYIIVPSPLIHAIPEKIRKSIENIENIKLELEDLIQNHKDVFDKWL